MKDASRMEYLLFSATGEFLSGTADGADLEDSVKIFAVSQAAPPVPPGWLSFRVALQGHPINHQKNSRKTDTDQSYVIGKKALCQVRNLFLAMREPENRVSGLRQILKGEIANENMAEKCHQLHLNPDEFMLFVIRYQVRDNTLLMETLKNLFVNSCSDYLVEMDDTRTVLLKSVSDIPNKNYDRYARMIVDNIQTEAMLNVWVAYGDPVSSYEKMNSAYRNACTALTIGIVFYAPERVFNYRKLGIGRLIYQLPADLCELFLEEVLGENRDIDFDEETMSTIQRLFDNNLNISETARQLYIHRNTLVYRLERIEKKLGLDIRSFEDAMLFKIALMVRVHLNELQKSQK